MDIKVRMYLAELFGTFVVVFVGAGTLCATYLPASDPRFYTVGGITLAVALAEGFALAAVVSSICYLSVACCNPAIALGLWVCRRLEFAPMALLVAAQLFGALLAGLALRSVFANLPAEARLGTPHLKALLDPEGVVTLAGLTTGVALEALFAFLLTVTAFATLLDRRAPNLGGVPVGLAQVAIVLLGFHLTGGAANPARWFGPAVWQLTLNLPSTIRPFADHAVYWVGPVLGALAGCAFYNLVLAPPEAGTGRAAPATHHAHHRR
jgi:glycerol uptake facilitator-like aquaporin